MGASGNRNGKVRVCGNGIVKGDGPDRGRGGRGSDSWRGSGSVAGVAAVMVVAVGGVGIVARGWCLGGGYSEWHR